MSEKTRFNDQTFRDFACYRTGPRRIARMPLGLSGHPSLSEISPHFSNRIGRQQRLSDSRPRHVEQRPRPEFAPLVGLETDQMERPCQDRRTWSRAPGGRATSCFGPPALLPPAPSPSRARAMHRATGRLTVSGKGSVICELAAPCVAARKVAPHVKLGPRHL